MNATLCSPSSSSPTILQLAQGSPEWLTYRLGKRNASESAAVLGLSPWTTPYQLWLQKTGRLTQAVTLPMQRGTQLEPMARAAYEDKTGLVMQPLVLEGGLYSASLDGMTLEGDLIVEIKCPMRGSQSGLWKDVVAGHVPEYYAVQVQHQLMVSGAIVAHLWVFDGSVGILHEITPDLELMERVRLAWCGFQTYLDSDTPPPLVEADTRVRNDASWTEAAVAYRLAKRQSDEVDEKLEVARNALLALAEHPKEQGAGVSVTRFWKQGNVNYKVIPELKGVDLDDFRGKARQEVRVSETD